jgi:hypothetical protein
MGSAHAFDLSQQTECLVGPVSDEPPCTEPILHPDLNKKTLIMTSKVRYSLKDIIVHA